MPDPVGHFLIDLSADAPPCPFPQQRPPQASPDLRVLNTIELARTVHSFVRRLEQGESARFLNLGSELPDAAAREMLRRMIKFWGLTPKRQYSRTKTRGHISLCSGINALHFFGGGRKPFMPPDRDTQKEPSQETTQTRGKLAQGAAVQAQQREKTMAPPVSPTTSGLPHWLADTKLSTPEIFPVDRWQLRDESARGLLLAREGEVGSHVRVGDVIGIQGAYDTEVWHVGVIRWIKSPAPRQVEMGVERIAPELTPIAVKPVSDTNRRYSQALLLPAMPVLQRPATILAARGTYVPGHDLQLAEAGGATRVVRALKLLERTASFDQITFAEIDERTAASTS